MKQKASATSPDWRAEFSFSNDIDPQKLRLIGAIALTWNFIEDIIDDCLRPCLGLDFDIAVYVTSRINGMDGKTAIIQRVLAQNRIFTAEEKKLIKNVIDGVGEAKGYRDAIIHARVTDPHGSIAFTAPRRGNTYVINFNLETLQGVL